MSESADSCDVLIINAYLITVDENPADFPLRGPSRLAGGVLWRLVKAQS